MKWHFVGKKRQPLQKEYLQNVLRLINFIGFNSNLVKKKQKLYSTFKK